MYMVFLGTHTLQYIALHDITLQYIALHDITLHYIALHYFTLPCQTIPHHTMYIHYVNIYIQTQRYKIRWGGRVRKRFFSRGGGGGNLICLEGVEAKGKGYGEGGGRIIIIIICKAGGRRWILLFGCEVGWRGGEGGGRLAWVILVRGGGRGGKIIMSEFGKRRGESIFLFAKKEFKPEGRGRGRGGGVLLLYIFFARPGGGGWILLFGCEVGWRGGEGGGRLWWVILVRGWGRALSYLPRRSSSRRGRVGGGGGWHYYYFIFFLQGRGGGWILLFGRKVGWRGGEGGEDYHEWFW